MSASTARWKQWTRPALVGFVVGLFVMTTLAYLMPTQEAAASSRSGAGK
ncbi:MAG TPA: hypothetical protein VH142_09605 [Polyangiaceae bacterium]|nr:hypothetical protein [Polyangiaceae bacterium]